jgi:hypothetical protein
LKLHWPVFGCRVHHVIDTGLGFLGFGSSQCTPTPNYEWTQQQNHNYYDEQMKLFFWSIRIKYYIPWFEYSSCTSELHNCRTISQNELFLMLKITIMSNHYNFCCGMKMSHSCIILVYHLVHHLVYHLVCAPKCVDLWKCLKKSIGRVVEVDRVHTSLECTSACY